MAVCNFRCRPRMQEQFRRWGSLLASVVREGVLKKSLWGLRRQTRLNRQRRQAEKDQELDSGDSQVIPRLMHKATRAQSKSNSGSGEEGTTKATARADRGDERRRCSHDLKRDCLE